MHTGCNDMHYLMAADSFLKCDTFPLLPRLISQGFIGRRRALIDDAAANDGATDAAPHFEDDSTGV